MPLYKYQCFECGLEFEELRPASKREECPCPSCSIMAKKLISSGSFQFQHKPTGPIPQNTGVASVDYNYDKVIGRDAAQKWEKIEERRSQKLRFLEEQKRNGNAVGMDQITPTLEGGFRTLTNSEISEVNENRKAVEAYNKQLQSEHKKNKLSKK